MKYGFSYDRIANIAKQIIDEFYQDNDVEIFTDNYTLIKAIRDSIEGELQFYEELREKAKQKILSQKKKIIEKSREWDLLLNRYFNEEIEKLEQLRALYHGYKVAMVQVETESFGIDTPEDLEKALRHHTL